MKKGPATEHKSIGKFSASFFDELIRVFPFYFVIIRGNSGENNK